MALAANFGVGSGPCVVPRWGECEPGELQLFRRRSCHNSDAFPDGEYLVGFHLRESFQLARSQPLHLDEIYRLSFSQAKVQSQVTLRHHAGSAMDLVHLNMIASRYAHARTYRGAILLGSN
jgi:hypothetical protein